MVLLSPKNTLPLALICLATGMTVSAQEDVLAAKSSAAKQALIAGRYTEAIRIYRELVAAVPDNPGLRFNLGLAYARSGDLEKAEPALRVACELDPRDVEAHYNLGAVLWRRGEQGRAAKEFRAALAIDPTHTESKLWAERAEAAIAGPSKAPATGGNCSSGPTGGTAFSIRRLIRSSAR